MSRAGAPVAIHRHPPLRPRTAETLAEVNGKAVVRNGRVKDDCQLLGSGPWMDDAVSNYFI